MYRTICIASNFSYWQHLQIIIDVVDGIGNSFSLESAEDKSFIIRSSKLESSNI